MSWGFVALRPSRGSVWPDEAQELLLEAAIFPDDRAVRAWHRWSHRLERPDPSDHRLLPLVYRNLSALGVEDSRLEPLRRAYRAAWMRNQRHARVLRRALSVLATSEIATLVVKGAALGPLYYRDEGVRLMGDVDILVTEEAFTQSIEALCRSGSTCAYGAPKYFDRRFGHAVNIVDGDGGTVDLHCHLLMPSCEPGADRAFWEASVPVVLGGLPTRTLCPTDHVLHACVHGLEWVHPPSINWVADALKVLSQSAHAVDWNRLAHVAQLRGVTPSVAPALRYLAARFDAPIADVVLRRMEQVTVSRRDRRRHELRSRSREGRPLMELAHHWGTLRRGVGSAGIVEALAAIPAYLRFWTAGSLGHAACVLAGKAIRMLGYHLRLYRYPR